MNASQNNFPRSRRFTYVASALGLLSAGALSIALIQVDALDRDYGTIRSDIQRYNTERTEALARRAEVLSDISQRTVEADGIGKRIADLIAQRDLLDAQIKQQTSSISEGADKLHATQVQAKAAADTIAEAATAQKNLVALRLQNADLENRIAANQSKIDQSNADVAQAQQEKNAADDAVAASDKVRQDKEAEIAKLNQQLRDLDGRQRQVADLTARQADLNSQIAKITKDIADKQRISQDLDATIAKLQDQAAKAKVSAAKTDADMARQEDNRIDLANQLSDLEKQKASVSGDLTSLAASADRARSDAANAEGTLKAAQNALVESEKALPSLKAQLSDVQSDLAAATAQRDSIKMEVTNLQALKAKAAIDQVDVERKSAEKVALETAVADLQSRHAQLAKELELKQSDLTSLENELSDLSARKGILVQKITELSDAKTPKSVEPPSSQPAPEQPSPVTQPAKPE